MLLEQATRASMQRGAEVEALLLVIQRYEALVEFLLEERAGSGIITATEDGFDLPSRLTSIERSAVVAYLAFTHGNVRQAAHLLHMERSGFHYRVKKLGLSLEGFRASSSVASTGMAGHLAVAGSSLSDRAASGCGDSHLQAGQIPGDVELA